MIVKVHVKRLSPDAQIPMTARRGDVAFDLYSTVDYELRPGKRFAVPTGIAMEIPPGYEGQVHLRFYFAPFLTSILRNPPDTILHRTTHIYT
jgi:dUTP pyrophosphatase